MCNNKETSITSYVMSVGISAYLWYRNYKYDKWSAVFLFTFSSLQLCDYLLWKNMEQKDGLKNRTNFIITKYAVPFLTAMNPIAQLFGMYYYENSYNFDMTIKDMFSNIITYVYFAWIVVYFCVFSNRNKYTSISKKGHLNWGGLNNDKNSLFMSIVYMIFLILPFIRHIKSSTIFLMTVFTIASLIWTIIKTDTWGSNWCWIANFGSLIGLMSPYLE